MLKSRRVDALLRRALPVLLSAPVLVACAGPADRGEASAEGSRSSAPEAGPLPTSLWHDATADLLPATAEWTNKVELADIDGDGRIDLLFANGGNYSEPGEPELNRAFVNRGPGQPFEEVTEQVFGSVPDLTRVIKARDFDGDGRTDIFVGTTYQTRSRLFLGMGDESSRYGEDGRPADAIDASGGPVVGGLFEERTATHLPQLALSLGDAEPGDVDGDGDLDLVLADWGPGNNMTSEGGRTRLWLNDGSGRFTDATASRMPATLVRFSWDLELVDVDNDFDLDVLVSCKRCAGSLLFRNDGAGTFEEDPRGLPQYTNNYEFEAMDLDGDGFLDLVTINDGEIVGERGSRRREHVFRNDGEGRFVDATDAWWPNSENIGEDDNVVAFLDFESDGDADFLIGSLSGPDRLLINDGGGRLRVATEVFIGAETPGTLGMAIADLDDDGRIDVVQSQGEHPTAIQERIFLGRGLAADTAPPVVGTPAVTRDVTAAISDVTATADASAPAAAAATSAADAATSAADAAASAVTAATSDVGAATSDVGAAIPAAFAAHDHGIWISARIHDRKSPSLAAEWRSVEVTWRSGEEAATTPAGGQRATSDQAQGTTSGEHQGATSDEAQGTVPMSWYGEYLWRARVPAETRQATVCASDAAGNRSCAEVPIPR